jgi:tetratricopeptide (TPR) repeat protein
LIGELLSRFDYSAAVEFLVQAQRRHPDELWINHQLAVALASIDPPRADRAVGYYRAALVLRPKSPGIHANLGMALRDQGDVDDAIAEHREAIRLDSGHALAHGGLGAALHDRGELDAAIGELREAIRLKPDYGDAHSMLGAGLQEKGEHDAAIAELREAIRVEPLLAEAHNNLGVALAGQAKLAEAIAEYREAMRLRPRYGDPCNNLAWLLANSPETRLRDPKRAVELAQKAVGLAPGQRNNWNTLGAALYRAGDWSAAIEALAKSLALGRGGDANDWFFLAMAHRQLGDKPQARSWYDKAVGWMEKNRPKDEELVRFRAEAEALLEVNETKQ